MRCREARRTAAVGARRRCLHACAAAACSLLAAIGVRLVTTHARHHRHVSCPRGLQSTHCCDPTHTRAPPHSRPLIPLLPAPCQAGCCATARPLGRCTCWRRASGSPTAWLCPVMRATWWWRTRCAWRWSRSGCRWVWVVQRTAEQLCGQAGSGLAGMLLLHCMS